ncbi:hypothetical protein JTB14_019078 [Gonioctena quinquepunctata]|nr:hypothetical protein JTB14_019078 [Gonioctena quinquepunctata]
MKFSTISLLTVAVLTVVHADSGSLDKNLKFAAECLSDGPKGSPPYVFCLNVKIGLQKRNGDIDKDQLRAFLLSFPGADPFLIDTIVKDCGKRHVGTALEIADNLKRCVESHANSGSDGIQSNELD